MVVKKGLLKCQKYSGLSEEPGWGRASSELDALSHAAVRNTEPQTPGIWRCAAGSGPVGSLQNGSI